MSKKRYETKKANLKEMLKKNSGQTIGLRKKTASNLFRYHFEKKKKKKNFLLAGFDEIIAVDPVALTLEVEGLAPYEKIVEATLAQHTLPTVSPELKHITIGGAIVGIGIESTGHRFGFVHDGLIEADVLLPNGDIVLCTPTNDFSDLFFALPNSYGTLGYILRAKIKLIPARPFVQMTVHRYDDTEIFMDEIKKAMEQSENDFIEGLAFSEKEFYLMTSRFMEKSEKKENIYRDIFYRLVTQKKEMVLSTEDYIFRYDPDWFWNLPETWGYFLFRRWAPKSLRNSGFYKKYIQLKNKMRQFLRIPYAITEQDEMLIQDWEVPWDKGKDLLEFALAHIDLYQKPWAIVPVLPQNRCTLYPVFEKSLYFNLGCYSVSKRNSTEVFHNTQLMDDYCFHLGGRKMLYSSTFLSKESFEKLYNGPMYHLLKQKYDPKGLSGHLYDKVCSM